MSKRGLTFVLGAWVVAALVVGYFYVAGAQIALATIAAVVFSKLAYDIGRDA